MSEQALLHAYPGLAGSDLSEAVLHQLKHWCIQGLDCATRQDHTSTRLYPRYVDAGRLPTLAALDAALTQAGMVGPLGA